MSNYIDFGGPADAPTLHFAHANGFPPATYQELLQLLTPYFQVLSFNLRPLWQEPPSPEDFDHWQIIADDLLNDFASIAARTPLFAVGHSLGAVATLLAARQKPALFRGIVLLDPVLFPRWLVWMMGSGKRWLPHRELPLIERTLRRRRRWESGQAAFERFRSKNTFAKWSDAALHAYVDSITAPDQDGGVRLIYSPEWEAQIYRTGFTTNRGWERWLKDIAVPVVAVRGEESDTFRDGSVIRWRRTRPDFPVHTIAGGSHLFPIEFPEQTAAQVIKIFEEMKGTT